MSPTLLNGVSGWKPPHLPIYAQEPFRNRVRRQTGGRVPAWGRCGERFHSWQEMGFQAIDAKGSFSNASSKSNFWCVCSLHVGGQFAACRSQGELFQQEPRPGPELYSTPGQVGLGLCSSFSDHAFEYYESGSLGSNHFFKPITSKYRG